MSVYLPELQFIGQIDATFYTQWVDLTGFAHVQVMCYSNPGYDLYLQWAIDPVVGFDYTDNLSSVIDTQRLGVPVRARYMRVHASSSVPPQTLRLCIAVTI